MSDDDQLTFTELVAVLCADQRERWQGGERILAEVYLARHALTDNRSSALDLIYNEVCLRQEAGEEPALADYAARFPQLAGDLAPLFEIHEALETGDLWQEIHQLHGSSLTVHHGDGDATVQDVPVVPAAPQAPPPAKAAREGEFGDYDLESVIAEGGMGVVYRARQRSLNRIVALKMIRSGALATEVEIRRFRTEATAAANLRHPNVVAIHEVGEQDGQHFFSMDFVDGPTLAELTNNRPLPPERAARYLKIIAEAVHYAHLNHTLHRDLKPSNILVDAQDQPQITDFGLAKQVDTSAETLEMTAVVGTPSYMSPEQIDSRFGNLGPASDVYSLGALLYELITGRPPFGAATVLETIRLAFDSDPVRPRLLNPHVNVDLETICLKCLQKEPRRRYLAAQDLADDLGRYLNRDPITARPIWWIERLWRHCRKRPAVSLLSMAAAILLLCVAIGGPLLAMREHRLRTAADQQRIRADHARRRVEQQLRITTAHRITAQARAMFDDFPQRSLLLAMEAVKLTVAAGEPAVPASEQLFREALSQFGGPPLARLDGAVNLMQFSPDGQWLVATTATQHDLLVWNTNQHVLNAGESQPAAVLGGHTDEISAVAFVPDSRRLLTACWDGTLRIWPAPFDTGSSRAVTLNGDLGSVYVMAVSQDGRWLAAAGEQSTVSLWRLDADAVAESQITLSGHQERIADVQISNDSRWLVSTSVDGTARLRDLTAPHLSADPFVLAGHEEAPFRAFFSPDSRWLITSSAYTPESSGTAATVRLWDLAGFAQGTATAPQEYGLPGHAGIVSLAAFDAASQRLVTAGPGTPPRMWDLTSEDPSHSPQQLAGADLGTENASFSHNGSWLVTSSRQAAGGNQLRLWDMKGPVPTLKESASSDDQVTAPIFDTTSSWLVTGNQLWNLEDDEPARSRVSLRGHEGPIESLALAPTGKHLATAGADKTIRLWDLSAPNSNNAFKQRSVSMPVRQIAVSGPAERAAFHGGDRRMQVWNWGSSANALVELQIPQDEVRALGFTPNGRSLISTSSGGQARLWELATRSARVLDGHEDSVESAAVSSDGRWLVTGSRDSTARVWDLAQQNSAALVVRGHERAVMAVAFGPRNRQLATAGLDGQVLMWELDGRGGVQGPRRIYQQAGVPVFFVGFADQGKLLVSASADGVGRIWDLAATDDKAGRVIVLHRDGDLESLRISSDGGWLATTDTAGLAQIWDLSTRDLAKAARSIQSHPGAFYSFGIAARARMLLAGGVDGSVQFWDLAQGGQTAIVLHQHRAAVTALSLTQDDRWLVTGSQDGTLVATKLPLTELLPAAASAVGRSLTERERREFLSGAGFKNQATAAGPN